MLLFLEIIYPKIPGAIPPQVFMNDPSKIDQALGYYAQYFAYLAFWVAGIFAISAIIYGGVLYLMSAGKPEKMVQAKSQISSAFIGLLIILSTVLVLNTINPDLTKLQMPTLEVADTTRNPEVQAPKIVSATTAIDTELPFGRIINNMFDSPNADISNINKDLTSLPQKIKNSLAIISDGTGGGADNLFKQNTLLEILIQSCTCEFHTFPDPTCNHPGCQLCPPPESTGDPCELVRGQIQDILEQENPDAIAKIIGAQSQLEAEIRFLQEEIYKLQKTRREINACPGKALSSWKQYSTKIDYFDKQDNWVSRKVKLFNDIDIRYSIKYSTGIQSFTDYATFYCQTGGTIENNPFPSLINDDIDASKLRDDISEEELLALLEKNISCSTEAPVGEIIDRAERTANLLITKINSIISTSDVLISQVNELQALVSQCSSKNCFPVCVCYPCGSAPCCAEPIPSSFPKDPVEGPCPRTKIGEKLKEIQETWANLNQIITSEGNNAGNIGTTKIIDQIIPLILSDLKNKVRNPMNSCVSNNWYSTDKYLFNAKDLRDFGKTTKGQAIRKSCQIYNIENNQEVQTVYGDCANSCFLEPGQKKYRECMTYCLTYTGFTLGDPDLAECVNELNFYCCDLKK